MSTQAASDTASFVSLDFDFLLHHAGGDPELLVQLCRAFLDELPLRREQLRTALGGGDLNRAGRALMQLQSCVILFGSGHVNITAQALEGALVTRRSRYVQREWVRLEDQLCALIPQVQRLLLEMSNPGTPIQ